jgi:oligopeptide/dipeptide ABC transporter ATP-binding protein
MWTVDANQDRVIRSRTSDDLLRVFDLTVNFRLDSKSEAHALKEVSFAIARGEIVGVLGESGSGKTTTALSLMQLLPSTARIASGSIQFHGCNILGLDPSQLCEIRGSEISMVFQDSDVLNPVIRVGDQVMEVLRAHKNIPSTQMRSETCSLFAAVGLSDCERVYRAYPHQLSGGERRRVAIAQALVCKPQLVIADEPTAWLDSGTAAEMSALFLRLRDQYGTAFLLISHDIETLTIADRILVMYAGEIVESGAREEVFGHPKHPYTTALLQCSQKTTERKVNGRPRTLPSIPGEAPDPSHVLSGCAFSSRCSHRMGVCDARRPELIKMSSTGSARCFQYEVEV